MINGILNIYKEKGYTSHDVVAKLRGMTKQKKIGHTGTLDPDAEGVLPVCLGKATKVCDMLTDKDKTYEAVLLLGKSTDTQDITGAILEEHTTEHLKEEEVTACILSFRGEYEQLPPMYSALKLNGKKLYELARQGIEVERKTRKVVIRHIEILEMKLPRIRIRVSCSKGTYIRTLCHDIGKKLKTGGCMESLLRVKVGAFLLENSKTLEEIRKILEEQKLKDVLLPTDAVFSHCKSVTLPEKFNRTAYNGNTIFVEQLGDAAETYSAQEWVRVYDSKHTFVGIFSYDKHRAGLKPEKMFYDDSQ